MNAYADSLLTLCLGWIKTVFRSIFNFFISDQSHSFGAWLGDHWLSLVLMLCLAGTLIDFAVYLRRYKPYLLWGKKKPQIKAAGGGIDENRFDQGFEEGVILEAPAPSPVGRQSGTYFDPADTEDDIYISPFDDVPPPADPEPAQPYAAPYPDPRYAAPFAPEQQPVPYQAAEQPQPGYQPPYEGQQPAVLQGMLPIPTEYPEYDDAFLNAPVRRRGDRPRR